MLLDVFRRVGGAPGPLARTAAMVHGAIFDVVNNQVFVDRRLDSLPYRSYLGVLPSEPGANVADAINVAARDLLLALHPDCQAIVRSAFAACYSTGGNSVVSADVGSGGPAAGCDAGSAGTASRQEAGSGCVPAPHVSSSASSRLGRAAAWAMLRMRAQDGAYAATRHRGGNSPGAWRPTSEGAPAVTPQWGRVTPFSFGASSAFRPPSPARLSGYQELLGGYLYAQQVNEVKTLGGADSAGRDSDQTEAAWFWAHDLDGSVKVPGHLLRVTAAVAPPAGLLAEARLFALVSFALADASVAAWDSKYEAPVSLWRPESAIRLADLDGNPYTGAEPRWRPLSADLAGRAFSPSAPSYVGAHAALAGAWAAVLREYFGSDRRRFTVETDDPHLRPGITRAFTSFAQAAAECARSRVYLGVNFSLDSDAGLELGAAIGQHVHRTQCYRRDLVDVGLSIDVHR